MFKEYKEDEDLVDRLEKASPFSRRTTREFVRTLVDKRYMNAETIAVVLRAYEGHLRGIPTERVPIDEIKDLAGRLGRC